MTRDSITFQPETDNSYSIIEQSALYLHLRTQIQTSLAYSTTYAKGTAICSEYFTSEVRNVLFNMYNTLERTWITPVDVIAAGALDDLVATQ